LACLPLPNVDGAPAELAYALDDLQLDGVLLFSNARGVYLGDSQFTPLFDELQRRAAVVFVHPNPSPDPSAHALGLPDTLIDFTADITRAIAQLHYSNTFARTPDVKVHLRPRRRYRALPGRTVRHHRRDARHPRNSPTASGRPSSAPRPRR
jgi:Amidohydrolase